MKSGDNVLVFTASDTFRGARGRVTKMMSGGAFVQIEGERGEMYFVRDELCPESDVSSSHVGGAE